ncbi:MAG TPA: hypothetical protein VGD08_23465 [Stellaceae bacterium]|jgi:hypothetical protein
MPNWQSMLTIAAVLACTPCLASAQNAQGAPPEAVPFLPPAMVAELPPDGCAWNSSVFSSGAIIIERMEQPIYFRCSRGSWVAFTSSSAAIDAQNKAGGTPPAGEPGSRR